VRPLRDPAPSLKAPSYVALHARMMAGIASLEAENHGGAGAVREAIEEWWRAQQEWNDQLAQLLGMYHEINNALVGIRGNAQLLQMGPVAQHPGVKERLEVVIRESQRIHDAIGRLREAKAALVGPNPASRAA